MKVSLRSAFLLLLITLAGQAMRSALADSPAPTEVRYWAMMLESREEIARLKNASGEEIALGMDQLAAQWEAITEVEVGGARIPVDHRYLTILMRADPPDLVRLENLFASLLDAQRIAPTGVFFPSDLASLTEILSRPEFQWVESAPNPVSDWIQKILDTINRWLNDILDVTFDVAGSDLTAWIMAVLLAAVLLFVFRTLFADFMTEAQLAPEGGDEEPLTSDAAFAKAQALSRGGDYRAAVRYLYLSTLLILDERGVMRYDRSKTNREYLRSVANSPELSRPLAEVIDVFDNVWYGYHSMEEDSFKHYSDRVEELKEKKA